MVRLRMLQATIRCILQTLTRMLLIVVHSTAVDLVAVRTWAGPVRTNLKGESTMARKRLPRLILRYSYRSVFGTQDRSSAKKEREEGESVATVYICLRPNCDRVAVSTPFPYKITMQAADTKVS